LTRHSFGEKAKNFMLTRRPFAAIVFLMTMLLASICANAQQPQIPTLQVCNQTVARGKALVKIESRADSVHSGAFSVEIDLKCDPRGDGYPAGSLRIFDLSMSDSSVQGIIGETTFEQVTTTGKHTPTLFLNGRCKADNVNGCRFWMLIADNKREDARGTPDIISFLVFDGTGKRVAYGTGPVIKGDITVQPTGN
jgi:hypothetical protein